MGNTLGCASSAAKDLSHQRCTADRMSAAGSPRRPAGQPLASSRSGQLNRSATLAHVGPGPTGLRPSGDRSASWANRGVCRTGVQNNKINSLTGSLWETIRLSVA
jgi:hypothetical protein